MKLDQSTVSYILENCKPHEVLILNPETKQYEKIVTENLVIPKLLINTLTNETE